MGFRLGEPTKITLGVTDPQRQITDPLKRIEIGFIFPPFAAFREAILNNLERLDERKRDREKIKFFFRYCAGEVGVTRNESELWLWKMNVRDDYKRAAVSPFFGGQPVKLVTRRGVIEACLDTEFGECVFRFPPLAQMDFNGYQNTVDDTLRFFREMCRGVDGIDDLDVNVVGWQNQIPPNWAFCAANALFKRKKAE